MATGVPFTSPSDANADSKLSGISVSSKEAQGLVVDGKRIDDISPELLDWLVHDARERGITVAEAYREEMDSQRELARITPSPEELRKMIRRSGPPAYVSDEPSSEFPF